MASHGGGLVGVPKARSREWTVPAGGWFNLRNAFDADRFDHVATKPGAASFCTGMPNYPAVYAIAAAASYVNAIRVAEIEAHADPLVRACFRGLQELPIEMLTPADAEAQSGIIAFRHPRAEEIHQRLRAKNIHLMCHAGRLRIALHGYNTPDDVDRLLVGMHEALAHV
jgi:selenocysteine lyase/cysteine desulfurase